MSIFGTFLSIEHPDDWAAGLRAMGIEAGVIGDDSEERKLGSPWIYQGSNVLPREDDPRGGSVDLALIPSHIIRDGKDDRPEDAAPWPWLRLGVNEANVVLNESQVRVLNEALAWWLLVVDGRGVLEGET